MIFYDTETIGLHGIAVLIQYAEDDGEVVLYDVFTNKISKTLKLIEWLLDQDLVGFNLAFDHFHLAKLYTVLSLLPHDECPESIPEDYFIEMEAEGRDGPCLKPKSACDLFLHSRKTHLQEAMERSPIIIRKVPDQLAYHLASHLNVHLPFDDYLFAKSNKGDRWTVEHLRNKKQEIIHPTFKNVVCRFAPSASLKAIAKQVLDVDPIMFHEVSLSKHYQPLELGYAPYAKAILDLDEWPTTKTPKKFKLPYRGTWPAYAIEHKIHWQMSRPREYARNDVILTRDLYNYFGRPDPGDIHSMLACHNATLRWKGFDLDLPRLSSLKEEVASTINRRLIAPSDVVEYITDPMDDIEKALYEDLGGGSSKEVLKELAKWPGECTCDDGCPNCPKHEVAIRSEYVLNNRKTAKKVELYNKLLAAKRFHASSNTIGTKTCRDSGNNGLNSSGIDHTKPVRSCFTFGEGFAGGDFNAFEVSIAEAVYKDEKLTEVLHSDKKIHAIFGALLFQKTYDEIKESEGTDNDLYGPSKSGFFALMYGGEAYTLHTRLGVPIQQAELAVRQFLAEYPEIAKERERITKLYTPVNNSQWSDPSTEVSSLLGFKRYFYLEFKACKFLFDLVGNTPRSWNVQGYCNRGAKPQTYLAALCSALFGTIYTIQNGVVRAAGNHRIQSTGAEIVKRMQYNITELQPQGIHPFVVRVMNVHDELLTVSSMPDAVEETVLETIEELREIVPLLSISWKSGNNWAEVH